MDADIYGHSVPRMLGVEDKPTQVDNMIMPPQAYGVKVISIGMFTPGNTPVVWRGPMLHRALQQFLADVWWGDLDVLLLDLPPGTGDVAISVAQLLPNAEILVVTTPQLAAAEVAERAGAIATQTHQQVVGVVENMSWLELPDGERMEIFGSGGGAAVSDALTRTLGARVPLLGQIPLDTRLREAGDAGAPIVLAEPDSPAAQALEKIADTLAVRQRGLSGMSLGLTPGQAVRARPRPVLSHRVGPGGVPAGATQRLPQRGTQWPQAAGGRRITSRRGRTAAAYRAVARPGDHRRGGRGGAPRWTVGPSSSPSSWLRMNVFGWYLRRSRSRSSGRSSPSDSFTCSRTPVIADRTFLRPVGGVLGQAGQPLRAEDEQRGEREDDDLAPADRVEHRRSRLRAAGRAGSPG